MGEGVTGAHWNFGRAGKSVDTGRTRSEIMLFYG